MGFAINPARVDFVTLRLFRAVAESGSISQGAEACNLAVSAASRRLTDFETTTGARLLERTSRGVTLTAAGHVAMQHAVRLFQGFELFGSEIREFSRGIRGHVRLWANMSALTEFLPELIHSFLEKYPRIRVEVEEQLSGDTVRAVSDGIADIGIVADGTGTSGLHVEPFATDRLVVVCARNHPLARRRSVSFRECLDHDIVGLNQGSSLLDRISRAAEEAGQPLRVRIQVRSFDAMCQMIRVNLGLGVMPLAVCRSRVAALRLKAIPLTDAWAERGLLLVTKSGVEPTAATESFLSHLRAGSKR